MLPMYCRVYAPTALVVRIEVTTTDRHFKLPRPEQATMRAKVYELASYLETIAAREKLAFHVEAHPGDRLLDVVLEVTDEALGTGDLAVDALLDLGVEACHCCNLGPDPNH